jgi:hypothetical protein
MIYTSAAMVEIALSAAVMLILLASTGGQELAAALFTAGAGAIALGMIGGVPAGLAYHFLLFRAMSRSGAAPNGWWWHPTAMHERLPEAARRSIMPWFRAGAAGFLLALVGCALVVAALFAQ